MTDSNDFWHKLDRLVATSNLKIERPRGTLHPRYLSFVYPLDYGYLQDTQAGDRSNIDVWIGSLSGKQVTLICPFQLLGWIFWLMAAILLVFQLI